MTRYAFEVGLGVGGDVGTPPLFVGALLEVGALDNDVGTLVVGELEEVGGTDEFGVGDEVDVGEEVGVAVGAGLVSDDVGGVDGFGVDEFGVGDEVDVGEEVVGVPMGTRVVGVEGDKGASD